MKKIMAAVVMVLFFISVTACFAGQEIPSLIGTWSTKSEGGVLLRGERVGEKTHWVKEQTKLEGELIITEQKGRVIYGTFTSKKASENFIGVIGNDNVLYCADEDGFFEGKIVNDGMIEMIYRHVTPNDTVVAIGIWTRKK